MIERTTTLQVRRSQDPDVVAQWTTIEGDHKIPPKVTVESHKQLDLAAKSLLVRIAEHQKAYTSSVSLAVTQLRGKDIPSNMSIVDSLGKSGYNLVSESLYTPTVRVLLLNSGWSNPLTLNSGHFNSFLQHGDPESTLLIFLDNGAVMSPRDWVKGVLEGTGTYGIPAENIFFMLTTAAVSDMGELEAYRKSGPLGQLAVGDPRLNSFGAAAVRRRIDSLLLRQLAKRKEAIERQLANRYSAQLIQLAELDQSLPTDPDQCQQQLPRWIAMWIDNYGELVRSCRYSQQLDGIFTDCAKQVTEVGHVAGHRQMSDIYESFEVYRHDLSTGRWGRLLRRLLLSGHDGPTKRVDMILRRVVDRVRGVMCSAMLATTSHKLEMVDGALWRAVHLLAEKLVRDGAQRALIAVTAYTDALLSTQKDPYTEPQEAGKKQPDNDELLKMVGVAWKGILSDIVIMAPRMIRFSIIEYTLNGVLDMCLQQDNMSTLLPLFIEDPSLVAKRAACSAKVTAISAAMIRLSSLLSL
jgi:hypothetical protein